MDAHPARHPTDDTLRSYGLGELDDRSARAVDRHLEQCPDCRQRSHAMSADSVGEGNRDAQKSAGDSASVPPRRGPIGTEKGRNVPTPPPPGTLPPGLAELRDYEIKRPRPGRDGRCLPRPQHADGSRRGAQGDGAADRGSSRVGRTLPPRDPGRRQAPPPEHRHGVPPPGLARALCSRWSM